MTIPITTAPALTGPPVAKRDSAVFKPQQPLLGDREGAPAFSKSSKGKQQDNRQSHGQTKNGSDRTMASWHSVLERKLEQPATGENAAPFEVEGVSNDAGETILLDTGVPARTRGTTAPGNAPSLADTQQQVDRIFKQVSARIEAAIRPGPQITNGSVKLSIPVDLPGSGQARIDISLSETQLTVKLAFPAFAGELGAGHELAATAAMLGQRLQSHLPGRRIQIVHSSRSSDDTRDALASEAGETNSPFSIFSPTGTGTRG